MARDKPRPLVDQPLDTRWKSCLLLQVRDDVPEDARRHLASALSICVDNDGTVSDIMASIVLVGFGWPLPRDLSEDELLRRTRSVAEKRLAALGSDIRIVSFAGELGSGLVGSDKRMSFTVLVPKFDRCLAALCETQFGQITDLGVCLASTGDAKGG